LRKNPKCGDLKLRTFMLSIPVNVEELLLAGAGVDPLAQAVPGAVGGRSAVGEVEGVGSELGLEPRNVCGGCGDGRMGGGGGGVAGGWSRAVTEVACGGGGGG
jgi:hypothetical protein